MNRTALSVVWVVVMILVVVGVDFAFFRGSSWTAVRLLANVGIVALFAGSYFLFVRRS